MQNKNTGMVVVLIVGILLVVLLIGGAVMMGSGFGMDSGMLSWIGGYRGDYAHPDTVATTQGDQIVARAKNWVDRHVHYGLFEKPANPDNDYYNYDQNKFSSTNAASNGWYRTDCSGFISYAWQLSANPDTTALRNYAQPISRDDLAPGDAINNEQSTDSGHVMLFVHWTNKDQGKFYAYEQIQPGTTDSNYTLAKSGDKYTISELPGKGTWVFQRKK